MILQYFNSVIRSKMLTDLLSSRGLLQTRRYLRDGSLKQQGRVFNDNELSCDTMLISEKPGIIYIANVE